MINNNYKSAYERQKLAREKAEQLLEERSSELYDANQSLLATFNKLRNQKAQILHQEKLASIGQLAAGVAHEINNPTGYVKSNIGTLSRYIDSFRGVVEELECLAIKGSSAPEVIGEQVKTIKEHYDYTFMVDDIGDLINDAQEGMARIEDIVRNLKDFSRPDSAELISFNVNDCIETALKLVNNEIKYNSVVEKKLAELPNVLGQPGAMSQVFLNLIINASHAIEAQGVIAITSSISEGNICVEVEDNGKGIPPELLHRLFDPFFTTKHVGEGAGLGLSISHGIISKQGGRITVESTLGKGTVFKIKIPINPVGESDSA